MIRTKDGRSFSERTPAEVHETLRKNLESLSEDERETLLLMLKELNGGQTAAPPGRRLIDLMGDAEFVRTPVDVETFVKDPYYLGVSSGNIYPRLLEDLKELFSGGYHEAIFTGSIGWGKTFTASIGLCRILYELSCMRDPQKSFGLAEGSVIALAVLSISEMLAMKVAFENIANKVKLSPYFQENFPFQATQKELRFPNNIWVAARAASGSGVLGMNVVAGMIDETNFMPKTQQQKASHARWGHYDSAEQTYSSMLRRMKSRFERSGKLPGMLFVVSSKNTIDDFTAKRIREAVDDPTVFVRDYATWDVKPDSYFGAGTFWVLCGNDSVPSRILAADEDIEEVKETIPQDVVLLEVPEDFRKDFERDLEGAIRDIGGVATVAVSPFIQRREKIEEAVDRARQHPFTSLVYDPSVRGGFLWEGLVGERREVAYGGVETSICRPLLNPTAPRHVHIDPSLRGDATGMCVAHVAGWKDVIRRSDDGTQHVENAPVYVVDFVLRVVPPIGGEIVLGDLRRLVYDLTAHGFMVTMISMDQYQSADALQQFKQKGYTAELVSVDRTPDPYKVLKEALYENRIFYYEYPPLIEELRKLEWVAAKQKVDHPLKGSKDIADALAGCIYTLSQHATAAPVPILRSEGQFQGDAWLQEQRAQATSAGNGRAAAAYEAEAFGMLPPFLTSSWTPYDGDDWSSGGWGSEG